MERGRRAKQNDAQSMTRGTKDPQGQEAGSLRMVGLAWAGHVCGLRFTPFHPILPTPGRQGQSAKGGGSRMQRCEAKRGGPTASLRRR